MEQPYDNFSQGLGTAPALANVDLSDEVPESYNPLDVNREAERYIIWVGSTITPSQIEERPDLRLGGEYFGSQYKTLVRSRGLLRRCQITPMEKAFDFMSTDMVGDDERLHVVATVNYDATTQAAPHQVHGIQVYPGDEINGLLNYQRQKDNAKGILEIEQLRGVSYAEFKSSGLQTFLFPEWDKIIAGYAAIPTKISAMRAHLEARKQATFDKDIKAVVDVYLKSCDQFYSWGQSYLKIASMLVKMPATGGFVHTYGELAEQLFEWLEIRREDLLSKESDLADIISRANAGNNVSNGEIAAAMTQMTQLMTMLAKNQVGAVESVPEVAHTTPELIVGQEVTVGDEAGIVKEIKPAGWFAVETASGIQNVRKDKINAGV